MKKIYLPLLIISLFFPLHLVQAQENFSAEGALSYLPDTTYENFSFFNLSAARSTPVFPIFEKLGSEADGLIVSTLPPLPESFIDNAVWIVSAKINSAESRKMREKLRGDIQSISAEIKNNENNEAAVADTREKLEILTKNYKRWKEIDTVWTVYSPEAVNLIQRALESGYFALTGEGLYGRPLYNVRSRNTGSFSKESTETLAYLTDTGELLVCKGKEMIRTMLQVRRGEQRALLDNQDYLACLTKIDRTHQGWSANPKQASARRQVEVMIQNGEPEEEITKVEESLNSGELLEIQSVLMTDELMIRRKVEYATEEEAREAHKQMVGGIASAKDSMSDARKEVRKHETELTPKQQRMARTAMGFAGNILNNNNITIEDKVVTTDIIFDKKQLNTLNMLLSFAKAMEEKEERAEEK